MAVLTLRNISKVFGGTENGISQVTALNEVSLEVHAGEFFSIIGPSGCGKSTLLRIIGGLLPASSGDLTVGNETVTGPHPWIGMRFYINVLATYFPDRDPPYDTYYQQLLEQVEVAEELGWECFMFNEHHFLGYGGLVANPAVLLAAAAARTSKIRLGPCIAILPLRHPLHSAEDYAMVDAISTGRLEFGIGSGNTELDYKVFGVTRESDRQRLREAIDVILKTWANERISHSGEFWSFDQLTLYPRTIQQPHPPIWVAGTSAEGLGWAGRQGYNIMSSRIGSCQPHRPLELSSFPAPQAKR